MNRYQIYMDRQSISKTGHARLMALAREGPVRRKPPSWKKPAALAACCLLCAGLGLWAILPGTLTGPGGSGDPGSASAPESDPAGSASVSEQNPTTDSSGQGLDIQSQSDIQDGADSAFLVPAPAEGAGSWPTIPAVALPDVSQSLQADPNLSLGEGSFSTKLTAAQISAIFAPEGTSFPWLLGWNGCSLSGSALYDAGGNLIQVSLTGKRETDTFSLELAPGKMPFGCGRYTDAAVTELQGVEVTGWSNRELFCAGVELMAHQVGARFVANTDSGGENSLENACQLAVLFASWMTYEDCPLTLDALLRADHVPAWRSADFISLAAARQESAFAPFLPTEDPAGYGDFSGHLTYQEGNEHTLTVRWSRGYDDVHVFVSLPEGDTIWEVTDASNPAAYDLRLYEIPWAETVPEAYQSSIGHPVFRTEDMSLAIVEARANPKDTGGLWFSFGVLHPDGTLVSYDCSGVTAEYVWSLVEATLNA